MSLIDLARAFPEAADGSRSPLPKQKLFLDLALKPGTPKYLRYVGGIGSGKTMIGCITLLCWAVQYPGDYLVGRQFMPELRDTTLKTFLEIIQEVGKELLLEYRVQDGVIRLRSRNGSSNILFRGLDEPDKLRSLNLNGFYIDEAAQVSEGAFQLLQGRLRGKYVRKGLLTSNSGGHDWGWRWFVHKDMHKTDASKGEFVNIKAPSTENVHLPEGYVQSMLDTWTEDRVRREIYADEDAFEGAVFSEFRRDLHVIKPFQIPAEWTRLIGIDHGYRNPACWLWAAVDYDENIFVYREFYKREWLIDEIIKGKDPDKGVMSMMTDPHTRRRETISGAYIDPSTRNRRGTTGLSDWDAYTETLPPDFPLLMAQNAKEAGIDRVKSYLKPVRQGDGSFKPSLYIFDTCPNLLEEMAQYRYQEIATGQIGKVNEKEEPRKVNDHACDALRYLVMSRPEAPSTKDDIWKRVKYNSLEGAIVREWQEIRKPKVTDPFQDF